MTGKIQKFSLGIGFLLVFIAIFLFWAIGFPHALSYQEQYQLFLFTGDYFWERISMPGGLAAYIGEFLTQFYYLEYAGAILIASIAVGSQYFLYLFIKDHEKVDSCSAFLLSLFFPVLMTGLMGDENLLLSYFVSLLAILKSAYFFRNFSVYADILIIPILYWCFGPMVWLYIVLRLGNCGWKYGLMAIYTIILQGMVYMLFLPQTPLVEAVLGIYYYRIPLPLLQPVFPYVAPFILALTVYGAKVVAIFHSSVLKGCISLVIALAVGFYVYSSNPYNKEKYELIRQDYLVRLEKWDEIIHRAEQFQVKTPFFSNCVNLALSQTGQLAEKQFSFYQSGEDALLMPSVQEMFSNLPTSEAFYRLGMINSALRYTFDLQESILNGQKSGRFCKRLAECYLIKGNHKVAKKYIDLLKKTLFYRKWAEAVDKYIGKDNMVMINPSWNTARRFQFKEDFLYHYPEIDKMLGQLFINNTDNKMALEYFLGELLLKGNVNDFVQYLSWAQQYGGYKEMPKGYQDAMRAIQSKGQDLTSDYAKYINTKLRQNENK